MVADQIEREVMIEAPVERVWTTLTSPEHLGKWFGDAGAEIDLKPGGSLFVHWKEYGTLVGRVEKVDSLRTFSYRWSHGPNQDFSSEHSTLVEFSLSPEGDGTRLRVVETGFSTLALPNAETMYNEHLEGWKHEIDELRDYAQALVAA
jgi:uncharacterized protein YndB with AHSA1/START domain